MPNTHTAGELKACPNPWCDKACVPVSLKRGDCYANGYLVRCRSCGLEGSYIAAIAQTSIFVKTDQQAEAEARDAWNTRAVDTEMLEALKALLNEIGKSACAGTILDSAAAGAAFSAIAETEARRA